MHKIFSVVSTSDRFELLCKFIESVNKFYGSTSWVLHGVLQGYSQEQVKFLESLIQIPCNFILFKDRLGMFNARQEGMKNIALQYGDKDYIIVCVDDDMTFCNLTNFEPVLEFSLQPHVGLVYTNWTQNEGRLSEKKIVEKYSKQPIVYTGGGLVVKKEIVELINKLPQNNYFSDNVEMSIRVYIQGYTNYRYLGSVSLHSSCRTGGRKSWLNSLSERVFSDERLVINKSSGTDVTPLAHKLHKQNRKLLFNV